MSQKKIVYAEIPNFNQASQYVRQLEPVETDNEIYYGIEILDFEQTDDAIIEHEYELLPESSVPIASKTIEERVAVIEDVLIEIVSTELGA